MSTPIHIAAAGHAADADAGGALHAAPRWAAVLRQQLRATGAAVRREAAVAALLLLALSLPVVLTHARTPGSATDMQFAEVMLLAVLVGLFAPMAVWKGEEPSRRSYLWAMPVERSRHTLVKVLAGWAWLMAGVAAYVLWAVLVARLTRGELSLGDTRLPLHPLPEGGVPGPGDVFVHRWPVQGWQWLVPFVAATVAYLLGSIVVLASDHPWRWFAGITGAAVLVMGLGTAGAQQALTGLVEGRYGLELLATGGYSREVPVPTPAGGVAHAGVFVPAPGAWRTAALLWTALALAGLLAAAFRRQER